MNLLMLSGLAVWASRPGGRPVRTAGGGCPPGVGLESEGISGFVDENGLHPAAGCRAAQMA